MAQPPPIPFFLLHGHDGNVSTLHFHYETDNILEIKPTLFSGSEIGEIFIWNLQSFRTLFRLHCPEKTTILFLKYHKGSLLSQNKSGIINCWVYINQEWNVTRKFVTGSVGFCSSYFWNAKDISYLSLFNQDKHCLHIYDIDRCEKIKDISMKSSAGLCMCVKVIEISDKWFVLAGYENGEIGFWDCEADREISAKNLHKEVITCLDFDSQHKKRGISGSSDEFLAVWKINDNLQLENVLQLKLPNPGINAVKIRSDGKIVITAGVDHSIRVFSWKSFKPLAILTFHEQSVQCLAFSQFPVDKKTSVFASGSKDKNIALWCIY